MVTWLAQFGEEYRPCKLTRHVYGIHRAKNQNDFMFARSLDYHLYPALLRHSANKPILIFVSTRKGKRQYRLSTFGNR